MIITIVAYKGGVGKTTTAIHLACYLQKKAPTLLIDGDANRSALGWAQRGILPFKVVDERQGPKFARQFEHIVIDTAARPGADDLKAIAEGCDLMIIPSSPDALAMEALAQTVEAMRELGADQYRILITLTSPKPNKDAELARATLTEAGLPVFESEIRRLLAFQRAALVGVPVYEVKDSMAKIAWRCYEAVGHEVLA
ncbi:MULTISPECIES: ParA family protein [Trichocoleus]|uniref:ParA family protein n=1 Tax=Trichocoleus desertorum GB2-A4 TaxID=2933944 RepID=A0ABV0JH05_9CYAN|nr:ParA family protein [Trichocoleus sp. FACHB-46]MBD1863264.1 ParA family protein [Trichocoleus sp. FACHB-46]